MYEVPDGISWTSLFSRTQTLKIAPTIPDGVTDLSNAFFDTRIVNPPVIPNTATNLIGIFQGCPNLTSAPIIPASVTHLNNAFVGCTGLNGKTIVIMGKPLCPNMLSGVNGVNLQVPDANLSYWTAAVVATTNGINITINGNAPTA